MTTSAASPARLDSLLFQKLLTAGRAFNALYFPPDHGSPYTCIVKWDEGQVDIDGNMQRFERRTFITCLNSEMPAVGLKVGGTFRIQGVDGRESERLVRVQAIDAYDQTKTRAIVRVVVDA